MYNILNHIVGLKVKPGIGFIYNPKEYKKSLVEDNFFFLRKTHTYSLFIKNRIEKGTTVAFYTHRNLLDTMASYKQKGWLDSIEDFVAEGKLDQVVSEAILFKRISKLHSFKYERLINDKRNVIKEAGIALGLHMNDEEIDTVLDATSLQKVKENMKKMVFTVQGNNLVDSQSGLHVNHINDPNINKWKHTLTDSEVQAVKSSKAYDRFNSHFGYR